jgi:hypothetical protein
MESIKVNQQNEQQDKKKDQHLDNSSRVKTPTPADADTNSAPPNPNLIQRMQALPEHERPGHLRPNIIQRLQALPENERPVHLRPNSIQRLQALPENERPEHLRPNLIQRLQALPENQKLNSIQRLQALPENERPEMLRPNLIQRLQRKQQEENELQLKEDEEEKPTQLKQEDEEQLLQAKLQSDATKEVEPVTIKSGSGSKMPDGVKSKMESSFNTDFSDVNIHNNSDSAPALNALAFTQGNDVHFAPGQYDPSSNQGQQLIGHELAHVVQQKEGRVQPTTQLKGAGINDSEELEKEADDAGRLAAEGKDSKIIGTACSSIQKKEEDEKKEEKVDTSSDTSNTDLNKEISDDKNQNESADPIKQEETPKKTTISSRVGKGGENNPEDVRLIQDRLLALSLISQEEYETENLSNETVNKKISLTSTVKAIEIFQLYLLKQSYGYVDPNKQTMKALQTMDKEGFQKLKVSYELWKKEELKKKTLRQTNNNLNNNNKISFEKDYSFFNGETLSDLGNRNKKPVLSEENKENTKTGKITQADYVKAAKELEIEVSALMAIAKKESGSHGAFYKEGEAVILYERHKMYSHLKASGFDVKDLANDNPDLVNKTPGGYGKFSTQHSKLDKAKDIDESSAIKSASWGLFQVMGENYKWGGYKSPQELEKAMNTSEQDQLKLFVGFIKNKNNGALIKALNDHNWEKVASLYNGTNWKNQNPDYAKKIQQYYEEFKKKGF